ncbi:hypothetical protein KSZ_04750 [Dictyobacter formicarum]|uniref:Uncharacterized protein n=1 Tax=Dictyobacter formicarum TaxID=2778368 RepID=A0ABQ3V916_9CHLR|nr:hypothetical protein KSZ_04750 [Dictyobacter formicarum]
MSGIFFHFRIPQFPSTLPVQQSKPLFLIPCFSISLEEVTTRFPGSVYFIFQSIAIHGPTI